MSGQDDTAVFTTLISNLDDQRACVVCLCGELDVSTVPQFLVEMRTVVGRRKHVIMDVHLLEYADSTALAAILSARKAIEQMGRKFCLTGCHGVVAKVMNVILVGGHIDRYEDVSTALQSISDE